jgi:hypothetical protein
MNILVLITNIVVFVCIYVYVKTWYKADCMWQYVCQTESNLHKIPELEDTKKTASFCIATPDEHLGSILGQAQNMAG